MAPTQRESLACRWGTAVADRRRARGMTQTALAEAVGVKQPTISRIEAGISMPSDETKQKIALALGVPAGELFAWPGLAA